MTPKHPHLHRATSRVPSGAILAVVLLVALVGTVGVVWGARWRVGLNALWRVHATATPTRTPRPSLAVATVTVVKPVIVAFTPTPLATAATLVAPSVAVTPQPMPADLTQIVARYGMDPSRRFIVVDVANQMMRIWDPAAGPAMDGKTLKELPVSTGDTERGYRTPPWYGLVGDYWGTFSASGVYADEGWYLFEDAGDILIHGAPYKLVAGRKVYEDMDALGAYPASHGCIRLSPEDARWFTAWGPQGVPLVILPKSP